MTTILNKALAGGVITEPLPEEGEIKRLGARLSEIVRRRFAGALVVRHVDAGSCNGCELEIHATNNAFYDLERFGVHFAASPRHADVLLITGPVSANMATALARTWEATPAPKLAVAVGDCAADGGVFGRDNYAVAGAAGDFVPVAVVVPGCPPSPAAIIRGLLAALEENAASQVDAAARD